MVAPPLAAMTSGLRPPSPIVVKRPTKKALLSEPTPSQLSFPDEFPYEFDSFSFTGDSTETEDNETTDDEDNFFAGLTRRLGLSTQRLSSPPSFVTDKADKVKPANSTESTQNGLRSPNGPFSQASSPPKSPFREEEEDSPKVISAAARAVAKVRTANFVAKPISRPIPSPNPNSLIPFPPQNAAFCDYSYCYWQWQSQSSYYLHAYPYTVRSVFAAPNAVKPASAGTGVFVPPNAVEPASACTAAPITVKPASAGTGVFIPRIYPDPSDSLKKSGGGCVTLPTKKVVHPKKAEEVSGRCQARSKVNQVGDGGCNVKEEKHLPKEWVY